jgi:hypothetical protein
MKKLLLILAALGTLTFRSGAAVLPAEKLLPDDTLAMFTIPDFAKALDIYNTSPQGQLWNDPAMKAFKDKFVGKVKSEFISPLEHDLGVHFDDYTTLPQGQLTLAVVQDGWQGKDKETKVPALLLLLDTKDKSDQLKTNLADLKKKWVDGGKTVKTEKIRDVEFSIVTLSSSDIPKTLKGGAKTADEKDSADSTESKDEPKKQVYIGQAESLLIMGNSPKVIEKVLACMSGGSVKSLGDVPTYSANHASMFRNSPAFGWVNTKILIDLISHSNDGATDADAGSNPFSLKPDKIIAALGLNGLKTIAFNYLYFPEGAQFNVMLGVPEDGRAGIFKMLAGEPKEYVAPPFVPADAVKFQRWRIDGQKTWAGLRKIVGDASPEGIGAVDFMLGSAETSAKEKDPSFDLKKNLFGNLGDDFITYSKNPKGESLAELGAPPTLYLIGSPNAEQLASALKSLLVLYVQQVTPTEREFVGHKIYSIALPSTSGAKTSQSINYASSGGYLAISVDAGILEEYLRSSQNEGKSLRDTPGLNDAAQRVGGSGTSLFGYSNEGESMRVVFNVLKKTTGDSLAGLTPIAMAVGMDESKFKDWVDFSLLPSYDQISKYFYFSVYGGTASAEGLTLKAFAPTPPLMKK